MRHRLLHRLGLCLPTHSLIFAFISGGANGINRDFLQIFAHRTPPAATDTRYTRYRPFFSHVEILSGAFAGF